MKIIQFFRECFKSDQTLIFSPPRPMTSPTCSTGICTWIVIGLDEICWFLLLNSNSSSLSKRYAHTPPRAENTKHIMTIQRQFVVTKHTYLQRQQLRQLHPRLFSSLWTFCYLNWKKESGIRRFIFLLFIFKSKF